MNDLQNHSPESNTTADTPPMPPVGAVAQEQPQVPASSGNKGFMIVVALLVVAILMAGAYLAMSQSSERRANSDPSTLSPTDTPSDEDENIGIYEGVEIGTLPDGYVSFSEWMLERAYPNNPQIRLSGMMPEGTTIAMSTALMVFTHDDFVLSIYDVGEGEVISYDSEPVVLEGYGTFRVFQRVRSAYFGTDVHSYVDQYASGGDCNYLGEVYKQPCGSTGLGVENDTQGGIGIFQIGCEVKSAAGLEYCDMIMKQMSISEL